MSNNLDNDIQEWWENLTEQEQYELLLAWYPTEIKEDTDIEKYWGDLPEDYKWYVYERENDICHLNEQERADIAGDLSAHRIMVEGKEIE